MPEIPAPRDPPLGGILDLSVLMAADPTEVWRAIVDPERNVVWLGGFRMSSSLVVGSTFRIAGQLNGKPHAESGVVLAVDAPTLLRYDHWSEVWRVPDRPENRAVMTFRLAAEGEGTRLSLRHELPAVIAIAPHARFFWSVSLEALRKMYATQ